MNRISLPVLLEDTHFFAIHKPSGLITHPYKSIGHDFNALKIASAQARAYLYPVHRLDKQTSGILLFTKDAKSLSKLKEHWHSENVKKEYIALVTGQLEKDEYKIDKKIKNKKGKKQSAVTHFKVLHRLSKFTLVKAFPKTGRKHQIRIHLKEMGHPIVGDHFHGEKDLLNPLFIDRLFLHHLKCEVKDKFSIFSPLPQELKLSLYVLSGNPYFLKEIFI